MSTITRPYEHECEPNGFLQLSSFVEGKVLVVDDESPSRRALHSALYGLGFDIGEACSDEEAIALCRIVRYDAVLLAINDPGRSGIETCMGLRRLLPQAAIFLLSVNTDRAHKVEALETVADDYVTKPADMPELAARLRAALRRTRVSPASSDRRIIIGDISLDPARRMVMKAGERVHLTPKEFDLLHYLMAHPGLPATHARLLHVVWGAEHTTQVEYLRTFIRQLRRKLEDNAANPRYLLTDSRVGYRFAEPSEIELASVLDHHYQA